MLASLFGIGGGGGEEEKGSDHDDASLDDLQREIFDQEEEEEDMFDGKDGGAAPDNRGQSERFVDEGRLIASQLLDGLAPNTARNYRARFEWFKAWCAQQDWIEDDPKELVYGEKVLSYMLDENSKGRFTRFGAASFVASALAKFAATQQAGVNTRTGAQVLPQNPRKFNRFAEYLRTSRKATAAANRQQVVDRQRNTTGDVITLAQRAKVDDTLFFGMSGLDAKEGAEPMEDGEAKEGAEASVRAAAASAAATPTTIKRKRKRPEVSGRRTVLTEMCNLRNLVLSRVMGATAARSDTVIDMELADCFCSIGANETPEGAPPAYLFNLISDRSKANHQGRLDHLSMLRHVTAKKCPIGALAMYLVYRYVYFIMDGACVGS